MKLCESCGACFDDNYDLCGFDGGILSPTFAGPRVIGGRYLLEQRIAAGAMGVVMRATHLQVGSTVAVKLMRPEKDDTHVALARFQREAQILGQIKHPNAVLVIDFGVEQRGTESTPYLVMEFLRGESLLSLLERKQRLTLEELERILVPLCDAVEEAHAVGVIHRDIKPSNIVLEKLRDGSEIVKVLDFGIAKFVARGRKRGTPEPSNEGDVAGLSAAELEELLADDEEFFDEVVKVREEGSSHPTVSGRARRNTAEGPRATDPPSTEAGSMIGTIPYMAPEQMTGERVSRRTDVHAVAVVAYQCLTGKLPYDGDDEDIIASKLTDERPSLIEAGIDVPPEVDDIIMRSFALNPSERPATVRELGDAIRAALQKERTSREVGADPVLQIAAQVTTVGDMFTHVEAAMREWIELPEGEEPYTKARDLLLVLDSPLRKVRAAIDLVEAPISRTSRARLVSARAALAEQVAPVRRSLARLAPQSDAGAEYADYLTALWMRVDVVTAEILDVLSVLSDDDTTGEQSILLPAQLFAEETSTTDTPLAELADRLLAKDPLEGVDALDELLASSLDAVVRALGPDRDDALATRLVKGLWRQADGLLLHELSPTRRAFRLLPYLAALKNLPAAAPFALLARVLGTSTIDDDTIRVALATLPGPEDRAVLARCMLVHPSNRAQQLAVATLDLPELWSVIAHPSTPVTVEAFLFEHIQDRARNEYLKIFFFCVRDNLRSAASASDVAEALRLVAKFFRVGCFHEDIVFEPLLELDRTLRVKAMSLQVILPDEQRYTDALAAFTAAGSRDTMPLESMRDVPLPIQRKLAREGHFLTYFVSHSNDRVARETLPHLLRLEDITTYLRIASISRLVLTELSKRKRFFRKEHAKIALLQNPKTPAIIARVFLPLIAHEQLRLLANNRHINPDVRRLVTTTLTRMP